MQHIMVDLETMGTVADAVILSIGAVRFDLESSEMDDASFYASISIDSNLEAKRRIQEGTLMWWLSQADEAKGVFNEPKQSLRSALEDLSDWLGDKNNFVWSNGADFDLPMLAHAYCTHGMEVPWKFWNARCFRTYKNLPGAKDIRAPFVGIKHNAMADAINQAKTAQLIYGTLFGAASGRRLHSIIKVVI